MTRARCRSRAATLLWRAAVAAQERCFGVRCFAAGGVHALSESHATSCDKGAGALRASEIAVLGKAGQLMLRKRFPKDPRRLSPADSSRFADSLVRMCDSFPFAVLAALARCARASETKRQAGRCPAILARGTFEVGVAGCSRSAVVRACATGGSFRHRSLSMRVR
ncbi:hypothetical protein B5F40_04745 [Gordonibacter sp. An230]|nr:hypothetical protein B5F40_04745 [Gordonibacter sp. An230]